jgi:hypothetical protein
MNLSTYNKGHTMTTNTANPVVGHAVYLEFVRAGITTQVILMPEATGTSHSRARMTMYRRRITKHVRKTWKASIAGTAAFDIIATSSVTPDRDEIVDRLLTFIQPLLRSLTTNEYILYGKPIVVEVTAEDVEQARLHKTPYKVISRITKTRKALGFPSDIVHWDVGSPAPLPSSTSAF